MILRKDTGLLDSEVLVEPIELFNAQIKLPRLLHVEDPAVSSLTKRCSLALLLSMSELQKFTIRRMTSTQCVMASLLLTAFPVAGAIIRRTIWLDESIEPAAVPSGVGVCCRIASHLFRGSRACPSVEVRTRKHFHGYGCNEHSD